MAPNLVLTWLAYHMTHLALPDPGRGHHHLHADRALQLLPRRVHHHRYLSRCGGTGTIAFVRNSPLPQTGTGTIREALTAWQLRVGLQAWSSRVWSAWSRLWRGSSRIGFCRARTTLEGASLHFLFLYQLVEGVLLSTVKLPLVVQRLVLVLPLLLVMPLEESDEALLELYTKLL